MEKLLAQYKRFVIFIFVFIFISISLFLYNSIRIVMNVNHSNSRIIYLERKQDFLKENVNKIIERIIEIEEEIKITSDISKVEMKEIVKEKIKNEIHQIKFASGQYIGIKEILNYNGGENYALQHVHPDNLISGKDIPLSTNILDSNGNKMNQIELNGINSKGEFFYKYYFKELKSEIVSEKIVFAKLYKDYNWIISMGCPLKEIDEYTAIVDDINKSFYMDLTFKMFTALSIFFIAVFSMLTIYNQKISKKVKEETEIDVLTEAHNRRGMEKYMNDLFERYKINRKSPLILVIDVDNFKKINDTYGHYLGDNILKKIVEGIKNSISSQDMLFRTGGDEFLLICPISPYIDINQFGNELLKRLEDIEYVVDGKNYNVTVSIGGACFAESDDEYLTAVERADRGLYIAKKNGKNHFYFYDDKIMD